MGKPKVFIFILCVSLIVQHIQIERQKEAAAVARWHEMRLRYGSGYAEANPLLAAALAAPAAPYILSGIVLGTGAVWCWTHGGKEAYYQLANAIYEGGQLTKAKIQEWIAQDNGISSASIFNPAYGYHPDYGFMHKDSTGANLLSNGMYFWLSTSYRTGWHVIRNLYTYQGQTSGIWKVEGIDSYYAAGGSNWHYRFQANYHGNNLPAGPIELDPEDPTTTHPELFEGPALLSNCHQAAANRPGLLSYPVSAPTTTPPAPVAPQATIPPVNVVAQTEDGMVIDDRGRQLPPPPGLIPDIINPPVIQPGSTQNLPLSDGSTVIIPSATHQDLINAGLPPGAVIVEIVKGQGVLYRPADAVPGSPDIFLPLAPPLVGALPPSIPISGTTTAPPLFGDTTADTPCDPGDPDFELPMFNTDFDWGEEKDFELNEYIDVVNNLPLMNVIRGSAVNLVNASPEIKVTVPNWLGGSRTFSTSFEHFESLFVFMGSMIYFCALIQSLSLALLGRLWLL